jgi:hypothetical protein
MAPGEQLSFEAPPGRLVYLGTIEGELFATAGARAHHRAQRGAADCIEFRGDRRTDRRAAELIVADCATRAFMMRPADSRVAPVLISL